MESRHIANKSLVLKTVTFSAVKLFYLFKIMAWSNIEEVWLAFEVYIDSEASLP